MQDTGNPRFDMARNAVGRRQDTSDPLLLNLNWNAPFVGSGTNACGVQPPIVCISQHYVLGNMYDRKTPYMIQYVFNVQRAARQRRRPWRSAISDRAASGSSACSTPTR